MLASFCTTTSSGMEPLHECTCGGLPVGGEGGVIGQRVGREQVGFDRRSQESLAPVRGLDSQETAGLPHVDKVNVCPELCGQAPARVEDSDRVQRGITEHGEIHVALRSRSTVCPAAVEPEAKHVPLWERRAEFLDHGVGKFLMEFHATDVTAGRSSRAQGVAAAELGEAAEDAVDGPEFVDAADDAARGDLGGNERRK